MVKPGPHAHKADGQWIYNKNKGFMPRMGHSAKTRQVVAVDFRTFSYH